LRIADASEKKRKERNSALANHNTEKNLQSNTGFFKVAGTKTMQRAPISILVSETYFGLPNKQMKLARYLRTF
jgi:hypothetical protein